MTKTQYRSKVFHRILNAAITIGLFVSIWAFATHDHIIVITPDEKIGVLGLLGIGAFGGVLTGEIAAYIRNRLDERNN